MEFSEGLLQKAQYNTVREERVERQGEWQDGKQGYTMRVG